MALLVDGRVATGDDSFHAGASPEPEDDPVGEIDDEREGSPVRKFSVFLPSYRSERCLDLIAIFIDLWLGSLSSSYP